MRRGAGNRALTSGGEEESHPVTPQGPSATGAWHHTIPRDKGWGQLPLGSSSRMGIAKGSKDKVLPGTPGKNKARWMFSFPTQLTELYSEWSDKILLGSCCA